MGSPTSNSSPVGVPDDETAQRVADSAYALQEENAQHSSQLDESIARILKELATPLDRASRETIVRHSGIVKDAITAVQQTLAVVGASGIALVARH
jgi:hypothetical protein